ncbi:DUF6455 family protein [Roseovarius aestuarii]|uniref:DUF6455 domain-containing protein n=2 Tax=Roseovarius aestuarii TaxID=475083 RepID=A0A1X7BVA1_9RHOB|nr:hypothetical protein ROA7745_03448 [Roseovarius aestuarii]
MSEDEDLNLLGVQRQNGYEGLMERLIARLGLNLAHCRKYLGLRHRTVERMMSHCAACGESETCRATLAQTQGVMAEPPAYCYNRKILLKLRTRRQEAHADSHSNSGPDSVGDS